ncbi:MAG TPA: thioredoxin domain-containing protein [Baekduia sp.]|uniref:thioredoxin domain-containing protein n=1 Tax=Baekduia sp. TaxID=2600305 RepID=UPI002D77E32F|nr:thioredoxin domain-containing protein [Baekduia sp.]HET6505726.1 thioredoxin domain-containing protein [Baekduia sp.]
MANALASETSPYLLQHKDNPVDWRPWGPEALAAARELDRPLLVSIGYSSCHWCHVMERESFEDPAIARVMNDHFVCVKVDREERPDVDALAMEAVQLMTGSGGWPLNVFLTPDQVPFYGGTYFPPDVRQGMPAWPAVLAAVAEAWRTQRDEIVAQGARMAEALGRSAALAPAPGLPDDAVDEAVRALRGSFDATDGGFGGAPKFPPSSVLRLLWIVAARGTSPLATKAGDMAGATLRAMARGGLWDQVGGGFSRYAVDADWTVPHFEKMLYDNALLARAYLHGWLMTGEPLFRRVCEETLEFVARELRGPEGGFLSALDADSEGVEGKFYVWTVDEVRAAVGVEDFEAAVAWLGVTEDGNFVDPHHPVAGLNVLTARGPEPPAEVRGRVRRALFGARSARVRPGLDDKRLAAWNGLAIHAFAEAGAVLSRPDLVACAADAAEFVLGSMRDADGRLLRTWKDGEGKLNAYLEDHAFMVEALLALYEATFDPRWFGEARALADTMLARFGGGGAGAGGFFSTSADHEELLVRRREIEDAPIPSGASSAAVGLLRLAALTGEARYAEAAESHLRLVAPYLGKHPQAFAQALIALEWVLGERHEVALAGEDVASLAAVVREALRPGVVVAGPPGDGVPLMEGRTPVDGRAAAYVCQGFACRLPVTEPEALRELLGG